MTAWVVQMIVGDRPQTAGDAVLLRGDNVSASGRCHIAKHIPGLDITLAGDISRWPEDKVHENVARLTNDDGWKEENLQAHGRKIFSLLLQTSYPRKDWTNRCGY